MEDFLCSKFSFKVTLTSVKLSKHLRQLEQQEFLWMDESDGLMAV